MHKYNLEYWGCNQDLASRAFIFRCSEPQSLRCGAHSHKVPAVNIKKWISTIKEKNGYFMARLTIRVEPTQNIIDATRKKNSPYTTNK